MIGDGNVWRMVMQGVDSKVMKKLNNGHVYDIGKIKAFRQEKNLQKYGASLEYTTGVKDEKFRSMLRDTPGVKK